MPQPDVVREEGVRGLSRGAGARPRAVEHPGVLPAFRFEGCSWCRRCFSRWRGWRRRRLKRKMAAAADPSEAVVAWIDGRLDLAFNDRIRSDLRQMSLEAQSQMFAAPELVGDAYAEILQTACRTAGARKAPRDFPGHRPDGRRAVDTRRDLGERRKAMGDRRMRSRCRARSGRALLLARARCHVWLTEGKRWIWAWQGQRPW